MYESLLRHRCSLPALSLTDYFQFTDLGNCIVLCLFCCCAYVSILQYNIWNSLPENVVTANTIDCFKTRLDKFWNSQDVKFDYKQNLTGLHNRSMIT